MIKYILFGIIIIILTVLLTFIVKLFIQRKKYKEEYIEKRKKEFDQALHEEARALEAAERQRRELQQNFNEWREQEVRHIQEREEVAKKYLDALEEQKQAREKALNELETNSKTALDDKLELYYGSNLTEYTRSLRAVENDLRNSIENDITELYNKYTDELLSLQKEVNEYQIKRNVINEQILRQRAIDEQQDFYRVCLSPSDIDDIQTLNSIRSKLHKHDGLDKLIYDFYISKPVQEMIKRVLGGNSPSGIYKITRLKTGEIYIGKSTDIKARWQQHAKTAFGCGTIAHSMLHTTMEKDGIENFTFELLEEVSKDKLTEKEKYWISFYDSKKYGLNEREG